MNDASPTMNVEPVHGYPEGDHEQNPTTCEEAEAYFREVRQEYRNREDALRAEVEKFREKAEALYALASEYESALHAIGREDIIDKANAAVLK